MGKQENLRPDMVITRTVGVIGAEIDGDYVLLDEENGEFLTLNSVASEVFQLLDTPKQFKELCDDLMEIFDVDADRCKSELAELIMLLHERKLVTFSRS